MTGATTDDDVIIINDIVKVSCTHTCMYLQCVEYVFRLYIQC